MKQYLPAVILAYNVDDGSYNLDVKLHAGIEKIRIRTAERQAEQQPIAATRLVGMNEQLNIGMNAPNAGPNNQQVKMDYNAIMPQGPAVGPLVNPFSQQNREQVGGASGSRNAGSNSVDAADRTPGGGAAMLSPDRRADDPAAMQRRGSVIQDPAGGGSNPSDVKKAYAWSGILRNGMRCSYRETESGPWVPAVVEGVEPEEYFMLKVEKKKTPEIEDDLCQIPTYF